MATATKEQKHQTRWFSLAVEPEERTADLMIYGDIVAEAYRWGEEETSSYSLSKQLSELDVDRITVGINSYGGDISEGLAIYNALKRHSAKVVTRCDGFACSIASVVFMAGDERVMSDPSMLMIHNGWTHASGNAKELRKAADDIEKMTDASVQIYLQSVSVEEDELRRLMDEETWIAADEAVSMGFATSMEGASETDKPSQSVRKKVMQMLRNPYRQAEEDDSEDELETNGPTEEEPTEEPETTEEEPEVEPTDDSAEDEPEDTEDEEPDAQERALQFFKAISKM